MYDEAGKKHGFNTKAFCEYLVSCLCMLFVCPVYVWKRREGCRGYWRGRFISTYYPGPAWVLLVAAHTLVGLSGVYPSSLIVASLAYFLGCLCVSINYAFLDKQLRARFLSFQSASSLAKRRSVLTDPVLTAAAQATTEISDDYIHVFTASLFCKMKGKRRLFYTLHLLWPQMLRDIVASFVSSNLR